jgi:signal transduction histidine kinase
MASENDAPSERSITDKNLRNERDKADRERAELAVVASAAEEVLQQARNQADAVLEVARVRADALRPPDADALVHSERAAADEQVDAERAMADADLRLAMSERTRKLAGRLPLEREQTDRALLLERIRADDAVAHRDDFMSIVSHDLRNLLSGIVMSATDLAERAEAVASTKATLATAALIQRYAARMNRLLGDLLDVGSLDAGRLAVVPQPDDLGSVVVEAVDAFRALAASKRIALELEPMEAPLRVTFDRDRIVQVLANLITNAVKFTGAGGAIHVRCVPDGKDVRCTIEDTGAGIPDALLDTVFQRFFQVGKDDRRGLGLGLYISRGIVEAHGGRIWAEPSREVGAMLCFTLPLKTTEQRVSDPQK